MKTILIKAIDPDDRGVRENQVLVSRIIGWYSRSQNFYSPFRPDSVAYSDYAGPITIVSIDSGVEYEIAESLENFRNRLRAIIDVPSYGFTGFKPAPPFAPTPFQLHPRCSSCSGPMKTLQLSFINVNHACDVTVEDPSAPNVRVCRDCVIKTILNAFRENV